MNFFIPIPHNFNPCLANYFHSFREKTINFFSKGYENGKQTWLKTSQFATGFFHTSKTIIGNSKEIAKTGFEFLKKHPLYNHYITPLRPLDYKLIGISSGLYSIISLIALKRFGLISLPTNIFLGIVTAISLMTILNERRNLFFEPKICDLLYELQNHIDDASKNKTNKVNFQKCINELYKYEHKKEKWEEVKKKLNEFNVFLTKDFFEHKRDHFLMLYSGYSIENTNINKLVAELKKDKELIQQAEINKHLLVIAKDPKFQGISDLVLKLLELPSLKEEKNALICLIDGIITSMKGKIFKQRQLNNQYIVDI